MNPILAYVGPGAGLDALGALLTVVVIAALAVAGLVWYPLRLLRHRPRRRTLSSSQETAEPPKAAA